MATSLAIAAFAGHILHTAFRNWWVNYQETVGLSVTVSNGIAQSLYPQELQEIFEVIR
ncbi:MAG: hypothetical protein PT120_24990 [Aphanizomenon gracile PMC649.10]|nr:hypothetical protein [Aphanizomenon gracile PMC649.10]